MKDFTTLPITAQELIDMIGLESTKALMLAFGGHPLYVPKNPSRAKKLIGILPPDDLKRFCFVYGGCKIPHIPVFSKFKNLNRNSDILKLYGKTTIMEIALKHGLCTRHVYKIISKLKS